MANRAIQAKMLKMKRQRLKAPVRLPQEISSLDHAPAPDKPRSSGLIKVEVVEGYRKRCAGLRLSAEELLEHERRARFHGVPPGRKEVIDRLSAPTQDSRQSFVLLRTHKVYVCLKFNATRTQWVIEEINLVTAVTRMSVTYTSKERAVHFYKHNAVKWRAN